MTEKTPLGQNNNDAGDIALSNHDVVLDQVGVVDPTVATVPAVVVDRVEVSKPWEVLWLNGVIVKPGDVIVATKTFYLGLPYISPYIQDGQELVIERVQAGNYPHEKSLTFRVEGDDSEYSIQGRNLDYFIKKQPLNVNDATEPVEP